MAQTFILIFIKKILCFRNTVWMYQYQGEEWLVPLHLIAFINNTSEDRFLKDIVFYYWRSIQNVNVSSHGPVRDHELESRKRQLTLPDCCYVMLWFGNTVKTVYCAHIGKRSKNLCVKLVKMPHTSNQTPRIFSLWGSTRMKQWLDRQLLSSRVWGVFFVVVVVVVVWGMLSITTSFVNQILGRSLVAAGRRGTVC